MEMPTSWITWTIIEEDASMRERKRLPAHPGGILKRQYLDPLGFNVAQVADALKVSRKTLSKIVNE